ncbi:MAG: TauD/TfdA dioxygenase family protein, partial [Bdellovibrionota bacterium]
MSGINVAESNDAERLRNALLHFPVLIFKDQAMDQTQFLESMRKLGSPVQQKFQRSFIVEMSGRSQRQLSATSELGWHADQSYEEEYPEILCLYAVSIPPERGQTHWANAHVAFAGLAAEQRKALQRLKSLHAFEHFDGYLQGLVEFESERTKKMNYAYGKCLQPVVREWQGRPFLCLNHGFTSKILDAPENLLEELLAIITRPENTYSHRWETGDLVIANNHLLIHRRDQFSDPNRLLYRGLLNFAK